jgi:hypothetical protein
MRNGAGTFDGAGAVVAAAGAFSVTCGVAAGSAVC